MMPLMIYRHGELFTPTSYLKEARQPERGREKQEAAQFMPACLHSPQLTYMLLPHTHTHTSELFLEYKHGFRWELKFILEEVILDISLNSNR